MRKWVFIALVLALLPAMSWAGDHTCPTCGMIISGPTGTTTTTTTTACAPACAMPCACTDWVPYCGCEMLTGLCINMEAACYDGTAGPLQLLLRDTAYNEIVTIELPGPIDGFYSMNYTFATPIRADSLQEAVLINETNDPVTLTWLMIHGIFDYCGTWTYINHSCPGAVIGPGGCVRMVLF